MLFGRVQSPADASAVARARNALLVIPAILAPVAAYLGYLLVRRPPPMTGEQVAARSRLIWAVGFLAGAILVELVLAYGIQRRFRPAWVLAVLSWAASTVVNGLALVRHPGLPSLVPVVIALWVLTRLVTTGAVRVFLGIGARPAAPPDVADPRFSWPGALPPGGRAVEGYVPPAPAAAPPVAPVALVAAPPGPAAPVGFDYFG